MHQSQKELQQGFGIVEVILIIVAIGLIGFVAWRAVTSNNTQQTKTADVSQKKSDTQKTSADPTANWITYTPSGKQYSIKVPDGWKLHQKADSDTSLYTLDSLTLTSGTRGQILSHADASAGEESCMPFVLDFLDYAESDSNLTNTTVAFKTASGTDVHVQESGAGMSKGDRSYDLVRNNKTIHIMTSLCGTSEDHRDTIETAIKTITL